MKLKGPRIAEVAEFHEVVNNELKKVQKEEFSAENTGTYCIESLV
jgi:hypothetical protein